MPLKFKSLLPDEPILLVEMYGHATPEEVSEIFDRSAALADTLKGKLYRITDLRNLDMTMAERIAYIKEGEKGGPGAGNDPRIVPMMVVGGDASCLVQAIQHPQFITSRLKSFRTMEAALNEARARIARDWGASPPSQFTMR
jgi:hypothetical protein